MIHRFRVQNFKSIADVDVELSPVTVLVGRSGTGKSNFVHALRFLRDVLVSNQNPLVLQQSWPLLRPAKISDIPTAFVVEFSVAGVEESSSTNCRLISSAPASHRTMSVWSSVIDAFFTRLVTRQAHRVGW